MRTWFTPKTRGDRRRLKRGLYPCRQCGRFKRVPKYSGDPRAGFMGDSDVCIKCIRGKNEDAPRIGKGKSNIALELAGVKEQDDRRREDSDGKRNEEEPSETGSEEAQAIEGEGEAKGNTTFIGEEVKRIKEAKSGDVIYREEDP